MSDISDPGGASRGDRRQARRSVDAAYAAGRISAVDRSLRMEQIDAASTRGDLAMVVRDLTDRPAEPPPAPRWGPAQPGVPTETSVPWAGADETPTPQQPASSTPSAPTVPPDAPAATTWPPPGYGGREVAEPARRDAGNRRVIGCLVAFVAFVFLGPCLLALGGVAIGLFAGGSDVEVGSEAVVGSDVEVWWDQAADQLAADAGSSIVESYVVGEDSGEAVVVTPSGTQGWTYEGAAWVLDDSAQDAVVDGNVDVGTIDGVTVQRAVDDALFALDTEEDPTVSIRVEPSDLSPRLLVQVTDGSGTQVRVYDLSGTPVD